MRTDCKISRKSVVCPNASLLGHAKGTAKVGDLVVYKEAYMDDSHSLRAARMIGTIDYAPPIGDDTKPVKGYLLVLALSNDCTHCYERWINPKDVIEVRDNPSAFAAWFFQDRLPDADTARRLAEYGGLNDRSLREPESMKGAMEWIDRSRKAMQVKAE